VAEEPQKGYKFRLKTCMWAVSVREIRQGRLRIAAAFVETRRKNGLAGVRSQIIRFVLPAYLTFSVSSSSSNSQGSISILFFAQARI